MFTGCCSIWYIAMVLPSAVLYMLLQWRQSGLNSGGRGFGFESWEGVVGPKSSTDGGT